MVLNWCKSLSILELLGTLDKHYIEKFEKPNIKTPFGSGLPNPRFDRK